MSYDKNQLEPYIKKQNAKLTQVILNFFTKSVQVVLQARSLNETTKDQGGSEQSGNKINKWFNLHMYTSDVLKEDLRLWKSCTDLTQVPPLIIETYLDMRQLTSSQILILKDDNNNSWTVAKGGGKKQEIVIERWLIEFDPSIVSGSIVDELPLIYKQAIILFRSLYGSSRLMPAYKLKKELNKTKSNKLILSNRVLDGKQPISSKGRIGLSKSIIPHQMLTTESHVSQRSFQPIQTSVGTLKVSIAYRNHYIFCIHDNEEVLSTHFISMDSDKTDDNITMKESSEVEDSHSNALVKVTHDVKPFPTSNTASASVSPCTSQAHLIRESSPSVRKHSWGSYTTYGSQRTSIQPFKVGSIGSSPPPSTTPVNNYGSSLERRISITSNKSTSNASLAAMLRNPRGSNSSGNATANIPIGGNSMNVYNSSVPRSVSSSHGSNLVHDDNFFPGESSNTPKFSSSFGSRASRRFSNCMKNNPTTDTSLLAVSSGSVSSGTPLSGIYLDDDISDFVRMIDSKSDLRFSTYNSNDSKGSYPGSNSQIDALSRFHSLKNQHQQLGDSVNASLILHHNQAGSRHSSRKSSHSIYSPPPSLQIGSYDNPHLPSVESRLREQPDGHDSRRSSSSRKGSVTYQASRNSGSTSPLKSVSTSKLITATAVSTAVAHAAIHNTPGGTKPVVSGLSTTPSIYSNRAIVQYENVFDDDDEEDQDYYLSDQLINAQGNNRNESLGSRGNRSSGNANMDDDDDDLLFTMSDMNLTKN